MYKIYYWHHTVFQFRSNVRHSRCFGKPPAPFPLPATHSIYLRRPRYAYHISSLRFGNYLYSLSGRSFQIQYFIYIFFNHSFRSREGSVRVSQCKMHARVRASPLLLCIVAQKFMCVYIECRAYRGIGNTATMGCRGRDGDEQVIRKYISLAIHTHTSIFFFWLLLSICPLCVRFVATHTPPYSIGGLAMLIKMLVLFSARKVDI